MPVQPGADRGAAKGKLAQDFDRFFGATPGIGDLLGVTGKFLAEPDRRRIHQMGAADLDNIPEFFRLCVQRSLQLRQARDQAILQLFRRADVNGGRDHVVARLPHVDVVVRVDLFLRANGLARPAGRSGWR